MSDNLKPYPEYKDSGSPWLGKIPAHWRLERAKALFQKMDRPVRPEDDVVTCFRDGIVTLRKNRRLRGFTESLKEIGYQGVRRGDLVIHAMDAFAGAIGVSDADGKSTPVYAVCQPKRGANSHYYAHIVREMARSQWIAALTKGIRERSTDFRFEGFASQKVPFPPEPEQAAIVRYLAHATHQIDRYIRAKQKLIKLLNEQKQAIIHHAVTRGLDPTVPLKPSGTPWLGDVPAHWEVSRIGHISRVVRGQTPRPAGDPRYFNGTAMPWVTVGEVTKDNNRYLNQTETKLTWEGVKHSIIFDEGTLILTNSGATLGVPKILGVSGCMNDGVAALLNLRSIISKNYLYFFLLLSTKHLREITKIGGQPNLNTGIIANLQFPLPPLREQHDISEFLDEEMERFVPVIARAERQIALMREYRTRLIADIVTGQLDVRTAAHHLPALEEFATDVADATLPDDEEFPADDFDLASAEIEP